ncbi:MAG TPA: hypothetical protein VK278_07330 [Gaiellaceae bacterium]|nr:hypothetical protein [Gaiellaceae bacterium]
MIYCVVPPELADELYDQMVAHYRDNPNVTVIVDRREGPNRRSRGAADDEAAHRRVIRDRRRARVPGTFPGTDAPDAA